MNFSTLLILASIGLFSVNEQGNYNGFALVELFTSQGCSSCPAADRLLGEMADKDGVIVLSFHVTYWNYLGWNDPYSSEDFTKRQRIYSRKLRHGSIYTPQMVVNGSNEFVGSNRSLLQSEIRKGTSSKSKNQVTIRGINWNEGTGSVSYSISGSTNGLLLNMAIVERDVTNYVPHGENTGRTLTHDNVVRSFITIAAKSSGTTAIKLPKNLDKKRSSLILFTQLAESWEITGAAQQKF